MKAAFAVSLGFVISSQGFCSLISVYSICCNVPIMVIVIMMFFFRISSSRTLCRHPLAPPMRVRRTPAGQRRAQWMQYRMPRQTVCRRLLPVPRHMLVTPLVCPLHPHHLPMATPLRQRGRRRAAGTTEFGRAEAFRASLTRELFDCLVRMLNTLAKYGNYDFWTGGKRRYMATNGQLIDKSQMELLCALHKTIF